MPLTDYYRLVVFERYMQFDGRAARPEFWWFILANFIIAMALSLLAYASLAFAFAYVVYFLAVLLPYLAVLVRRLHDTGRSGYYAFWVLLPLIGGIVLIVLCAQEGESGENQYGSVPQGLPA